MMYVLFFLLLSCAEFEGKYALDDDGDGFSEFDGDCNDQDSRVNPQESEICDSVDNNCNGEIDEGAVDGIWWYPDDDGDGFGRTNDGINSCTPEEGFVSKEGDCQDNDPSIHPEAREICDEEGVDENCNEISNEALVGNQISSGTQTFYLDQDNDGFGDSDNGIPLCSLIAGYVNNDLDCDDSDALISPDGIEICDGVDNDCDDKENYDGIDEDFAADAFLFFLDNDGDNFGVPFAASTEEMRLWNPDDHKNDEGQYLFVFSCSEEPPQNYSSNSGDCDDTINYINPNATEYCNDIDEDCDGDTNDSHSANAPKYYLDTDGDGFGGQEYENQMSVAFTEGINLEENPIVTACSTPDNYSPNNLDCNDDNTTIFPSAPEICDGVDNNCDDLIDGDDSVNKTIFYADVDEDGFGDPNEPIESCFLPEGAVDNADDCNDQNDTLNQLDSDQDGNTSCDGDCDDSRSDLNMLDLDGDGFTSCGLICDEGEITIACVPDCNDGNELISPNAIEICDGLDNNCDDFTDGQDAIDKPIWYPDADEDGFGFFLGAVGACNQPEGFISDSTDCNDDDANKNPNADELCSTEEDDDCDGEINEDSAVDVTLYYQDADSDGYGVALYFVGACTLPAGYAERNGDDWDCNDNDSLTRPYLTEYCNDKDDDCDGLIDELPTEDPLTPAQDTVFYYADSDNDGFGTMEGEADIALCSNSNVELFEGISADNRDCDDNDSSTYPGAPEDCAEVDRNCDELPDLGAIDQKRWHVDSDGDAYGDENLYFYTCNEPPGFVLSPEDGGPDKYDCNDVDGQAFPQAPEYCNGKLEDCDRVGEDGLRTEPWFLDDAEDVLAFEEAIANGEIPNMVLRYIPADEWDDDGDNTVECDLDVNPIAWSSSQKQKIVDGQTIGLIDGLDCDDLDARFYRGAALYEPANVCVKDEDGDGYGDMEPSEQYDVGSDCDDAKDYVYPFAPETCNGRHDDCEEFLDIGGIPTDELDDDGDGYVECDRTDPVPEWFGEDGFTYIGEDGLSYVYGGDCNDTLNYVFKGAAINSPEICAQDVDGDGEPDCALSSYISDYNCDYGVFFENGFGADFILIEGDALIDPGMGGTSRYILENPFYVMTTEVTQGMFEGLMGYNPSSYVHDYKPVESINWHEAAAFANAMSIHQEIEECYACEGSGASVVCEESMNPLRCNGYRLPTESEWELIMRSGTTSDFWTGTGDDLGGTYSSDNCSLGVVIEDGALQPSLSDYAWFCGTDGLNGFEEGSKVVGQLLPNGFGLYDTVGNVWEWTTDWSGCSLEGNWCRNPKGEKRRYRGMNYDDNPSVISIVGDTSPTYFHTGIGFRLITPLLEDKDGDGVINMKDCDDSDPLVLSNMNDKDCDNIVSFEDCDDENPLFVGFASDADCDGILNYNDCDDTDPTLKSKFIDKDCDNLYDIEVFSAGDGMNCGIDVNGNIRCWGRDYSGQVSNAPVGTFVQVSAGSSHSCGIDTSGTVHCWGNDDDDQVSDAPVGDFVQVSAGDAHSCGVDIIGTVHCWGKDNDGRSSPPDDTFVQVSAGGAHSCGIDIDGSIHCWGDDYSGQVSDTPVGTFVQVSAGDAHSCGIDTSGSVQCWGDDVHGQSSPLSGYFTQVAAGNDHNCGIDINGVVQCWGKDDTGQSSPPDDTFVQVSAGGAHSCGIDIDGSIHCWGNIQQSSPPSFYFPWYGQCDFTLDGDCDGIPPEQDCNDFDADWSYQANDYDCDGKKRYEDCNELNPNVFEVTDGDEDCDGINDIEDCDPENMFATFTNNDADCDGVDVDLDCDDSDNTAVSTTIDLTCDGFYDIEVVSAGSDHSCSIDINGIVQCWGRDFDGESSPPDDTFVQVSTGWRHSCGIDIYGSIHCWGDDNYGQSSPPSVRFVQVSAGGSHSCGIDIDGAVHCWGDDFYGQVSDTPVGTFVQVSAGNSYNCGIDIDGTIHCWGYDNSGQVSDTPVGTFVQVSSSLGGAHSCGIDTSGSVQCWGDDFYGQVSDIPVGNFVHVFTGNGYSCGIDTSGSVQCWGVDNYGQVSDAPTGTFVQVSSGSFHSCGIDVDGAVHCWGDDWIGQVSDIPSDFRAWNGGQ